MRCPCLIFALICCNILSANILQKSKQTIVGKNNQLFIAYNNQEFVVNNIITVKFADILSLRKKYLVRNYNKLSYADIVIPNTTSIEDYISILQEDPNVLSIDLNSYGEYTSATPNDAYFSDQWYLSEILVDSAWTITNGSPNIKVAILDSGVDWLHPDLGMGEDSYQNIYCNPAEDDWKDPNDPNSGNHIDDDGNGFVDDYKGWDFATNSNDSRPRTYFHGTFVAGIIGAKTNNSIGIAGIAGGNYSKGINLLPYGVGDPLPETSIIDDAIIAAVDNNCQIIQLSLFIPQESAIDAALEYARCNNVTVVCASGNLGESSPVYPASHPTVIAVGGLEQDFRRWPNSNYGTNLSVMARCTGLVSTSLTSNEDIYKYNFGTSFAAPQVSAIIALMLSVNSNLTCEGIRYIIESTAQKVGNYYYKVIDGYPNGTWNDSVGYGLVNAYAAVLAAKKKYIQNHTYHNGSVIFETYPEIIAGYDVIESKPYGNVKLEAGSDVTFSATERVVLKPGFHAKAGSNLHVKIETPTANIASAPQRVAPTTPSDDTNSTDEVVTNNGLESTENEVIVSTSIYTISGQLIQTISSGQHDATHLPNGMYILQHRMSDGSMRSEKIANYQKVFCRR